MSFTDLAGKAKKAKDPVDANKRAYSDLIDAYPDLKSKYKKTKFDAFDLRMQFTTLDKMESEVNKKIKEQEQNYNSLYDSIKNLDKFLKKKFDKLSIEDADRFLDEMNIHKENEEEWAKVVTKIHAKYVLNDVPDPSLGVDASGTLAIKNVATGSKAWDQVQEKGKKHGCWSCKVKMGDKNAASWVADHIPPQALNTKKIIDGLNLHFKTKFKVNDFTLYPSCVKCSRKQMTLVKKVISHFGDKLTKKTLDDILMGNEHKMLIGGSTKNGISVSGSITKAAHKAWDGIDLECHICGTDVSTSDDTSYTADHYPPKEFNTHYAETLFRLLGLEVKDPKLFPQCIKCSSKQGNLSSDSKILINGARFFGIAVNK